MGADFVSTALSSYLMSLDPWIPLVTGFAIVMGGMMLILALPETKHALPARPLEQPPLEMSELADELEPKHNSHEPNAPEPYYEEPDTDEHRVNEAPSWSIPSHYSHQSFSAKIHANYRFYLRPYLFILSRKPVLLLLTAFLVYRLSRGSSWFLAQYISIRYSWTLAESNFLVACRPTVSIPLFIFGLPYLKRVLSTRYSATEKDLWLARGSIICLTIGTLGIGLSPSIATVISSMIVQTCGSGFLFLVRSIITTLVKRDETARLFTAIEIIQSFGNVIASLTITTVFQVGLRLGGFWIGLAWMMTSSLFCLVGLAIWYFKLPLSPTPEFVVENYDEDDRT